jgi:Helix-turn-helix domain of resolvase
MAVRRGAVGIAVGVLWATVTAFRQLPDRTQIGSCVPSANPASFMSSSIRMRSGDMVISFSCSSAGDRRLPPEGCSQSGHRAAFIPNLGEAVPSKGRKPSIDAAEVRRLREQEKLGPAAIARRLGIGRASVYRALGKSAPPA